MAQRAPEETYGDVLKRLAADERGGGRIGGPRKPPTEEPGAEAMPTPGVIEGKTVPGAKGKINASLEARGFTPEQIAAMKPKDKTAILQKREGEVGAGPPAAARSCSDRPKLANRMLNQPAVLRSEAAKRGITPDALKTQATEVLKTPALPGRPAEMSPVGGEAVPAKPRDSACPASRPNHRSRPLSARPQPLPVALRPDPPAWPTCRRPSAPI